MHFALHTYVEAHDNPRVGQPTRFPEMPSDDQIKEVIIQQVVNGELDLRKPQQYFTRLWRVRNHKYRGNAASTVKKGHLQFRRGADGRPEFF